MRLLRRTVAKYMLDGLKDKIKLLIRCTMDKAMLLRNDSVKEWKRRYQRGDGLTKNDLKNMIKKLQLPHKSDHIKQILKLLYFHHP